MQKPLLIILDMIGDGFDGWDRGRRNRLVDNINELTAVFRMRGLPILWVRQEYEPDLSDAFLEMRRENIFKYIRGTPGAELLPDLVVAPSDQVIIKKRYSAFFNTSLDQILAELSVDDIVLA